MKTPILVTGATGFVGRSLCRSLIDQGYEVRASVRRNTGDQRPDSSGKRENSPLYLNIGDILPDTDWSRVLRDVDTVVHLAARVHVTNEDPLQSLDEYRTVNTLGTANLANQAARAGVRRFVYLSTVKVHGEETSSPLGRAGNSGYGELPTAFSETDVPCPQGGYAISKWEAEQELMSLARATGLQTVIIRPPLIYGPGVKANFLRLLRSVDKGIPLPLGSIANERSLLGLDNLVDFILQCIRHPDAADETFLVADDEVLSTPDLIRRIAFYMNKSPRLLAFPGSFLKMGGRLIGKSAQIGKLCGSLRLDTSKAKRLLHWVPPISVDQGLEKTVTWYLKKRK